MELGRKERISFIHPPHEFPTHSPTGKPLMVDFRSRRFADFKMIFGSPEWRRYNIRLFRWASRRINQPDFKDEIIVIGRDELLQECLSFGTEYGNASPMIFSRILKTGLLTNINIALRKRSGGKDPITKKNKQIYVKQSYRFHSVYDVYYAMAFQCSVWLPWYMEKFSGGEYKAEDITWADIEQELRFILELSDREVSYDYMTNLTPDQRDAQEMRREE